MTQALAEAAACFANANGAVVMVGVRDRPGGPKAIEGTELDGDLVLRRIWLTSPTCCRDCRTQSRRRRRW